MGCNSTNVVYATTYHNCIVNNFVIVDELKYRCNTSVYCVTVSIIRAAVNWICLNILVAVK